MRGRVWISVWCLVAIAGGGWLAVVWQSAPSRLAEHWRQRLAGLPEEAIEPALRQVAALDDKGLEFLVEALASSRQRTSAAAGRLLHGRLDAWRQQAAAESYPKVQKLAALLARHAARLDRSALDTAGKLARRMLHWPAPRGEPSATRLVSDCEKIVRRWVSTGAAEQRDGLDPGPVADRGPEATRRGSDEPAMRDDRVVSASVPDWQPPALPGGDLPLDIVQMPPLPPSLAGPPQPRPVIGDGPKLLPPRLRQLPRPLFTEEEAPVPGPDAMDQPATPPSPPEPRELDAVPSGPIQPLAAPGEADPEGDVTALHELDLIRRLTRTSTRSRNAAKIELRRRGFRPLEFKLAERLNHPDPAVRLALLEVIDELPTAAGRWLIWLSQDPDPAVRRAAVARMATSQDPQLHRRLETMQPTETDPAVQRQIERWSRQRSQSSRWR